MKKGFSSVVVALTAVTLIFQGCAGLGSMQKHMEELNFKVEPSPLEVHGDSVKVTISGKFPEKYFAKAVSAEATPAIVWNGGEATLKVQEFKGESFLLRLERASSTLQRFLILQEWNLLN